MTFKNILKICRTCKKFIQCDDPDKDFCSGGERCYAITHFSEYEPKESVEEGETK